MNPHRWTLTLVKIRTLWYICVQRYSVEYILLTQMKEPSFNTPECDFSLPNGYKENYSLIPRPDLLNGPGNKARINILVYSMLH